MACGLALAVHVQGFQVGDGLLGDLDVAAGQAALALLGAGRCGRLGIQVHRGVLGRGR